jgi:hypothetical protein
MLVTRLGVWTAKRAEPAEEFAQQHFAEIIININDQPATTSTYRVAGSLEIWLAVRVCD